MNDSIILGLFTVFFLMLILSDAMEDAEVVVTSTLPSLELLYQVTGSKVAAIEMQFGSLPCTLVRCSIILGAQQEGSAYNCRKSMRAVDDLG